jgi:hypothetical protein
MRRPNPGLHPGYVRYPDTPHCGYYEFLKFEREQQGDPEFVATTT